MKICGVYRITNAVNGKQYVGSGVNIYNRWSSHKSRLQKNNHFNVHLQRAWNCYGESNFVFEIMVICATSELIKYEQLFIDQLKPEYNIAKKARSMLGFRHTEETKRICRDAAIGNRGFSGHHHEKSIEEREKISKALKGRPFSKEHCEKISKSKSTHEMREKLIQANKDRIWTQEARKKLSTFHKGKHVNRLPNGQFAKGGGLIQ